MLTHRDYSWLHYGSFSYYDFYSYAGQFNSWLCEIANEFDLAEETVGINMRPVANAIMRLMWWL